MTAQKRRSVVRLTSSVAVPAQRARKKRTYCCWANKTIPLILCTEEDVKGSHGASIGELEQGMLFYFEARGISREEAEKIVAKARLERLCQDTEDAKTAEYMHQIIEEVI